MSVGLDIWKFRSRQAAISYIKFQRTGGVEMAGAKVRMRKYPDHKWANRVGNVPVIQKGHDPGGELYLFTDGIVRYHYLEGSPKD